MANTMKIEPIKKYVQSRRDNDVDVMFVGKITLD